MPGREQQEFQIQKILGASGHFCEVAGPGFPLQFLRTLCVLAGFPLNPLRGSVCGRKIALNLKLPGDQD
jgi:hypothetical protein